MGINLSKEQENFIDLAIKGNNILVDACIGSGKTTAIQHLCCNPLLQESNILYLTYNKLLKLDAQSKIKSENVTVTNYHGFALNAIDKSNKIGVSMLIKEFNKQKPDFTPFDILIIDEYQDIEQEVKEMLYIIKDKNPKMQIIAVGDMEQKIYDKTTLYVPDFIVEFLGKYKKLKFTQCFRLNAEHAELLGRIWNKEIVGVNEKCKVEIMSESEVVSFLGECETRDILCLGGKKGIRTRVQNEVEERYPQKFNKKTLYSSISDEDSGSSKPSESVAVFTTFDGSKGLERRFCIVFDFTESYWQTRIKMANQKYRILRNIFCVAASRGKEKIIFVHNDEERISEKTLSEEVETNTDFKDVNISEMFDFTQEHTGECFDLLERKPISNANDHLEIGIDTTDNLIDLSPCIGIYSEAVFFHKYNIDKDVELKIILERESGRSFKNLLEKYKNLTSLNEKILFLASIQTEQNRYRTQVEKPFVCEINKGKIINRLKEIFNEEEDVQKKCRIPFSKEKGSFLAVGLADVVKDNKVYELKFVSGLENKHFLQCACYMCALELEVGVLWNIRNNEMWEIRIPDKKIFLDSVTKAITKGVIEEYKEPDYIKLEYFDTDKRLSSIDEDTPKFKEILERVEILEDYTHVRDYLDNDRIFSLKDIIIWRKENKKKQVNYGNILISDTGELLYTESRYIQESILSMVRQELLVIGKNSLKVTFHSEKTKKGRHRYTVRPLRIESGD
ncbi:MAG: AAA family ATPase [Defluviitaleaceae bacterium]|nr:AAA family ATPase [Defluviitaleaceae bacterium]